MSSSKRPYKRKAQWTSPPIASTPMKKTSYSTESPKKSGFSPIKLSSPIKVIQGAENMYNGGADYSKPKISSSQSSTISQDSGVAGSLGELDDPDLLLLSNDVDMDPDFGDEPSFSQAFSVPDAESEVVISASQTSTSSANDLFSDTDPDLMMLSQDMDLDPSFGEDCDKNDRTDYFMKLPPHVLESIFSRLPMLDICLHMTRVCSYWNSILSEPDFLRWKKLYYRILRGSQEHTSIVHSQMAKYGMVRSNKETVLPGLIRLMKDFKNITSTSLNMTECLKSHPKYDMCLALMQERFQDCIEKDVANPWSMITALVILAENENDILRILSVLLSPQSQCTAQEVIECMYCIASYLLVLKQAQYKEVWTGMHYRLYYALYLFENSSDVKTDRGNTKQKGSSPANPRHRDLTYTQEQMRICNHHVSPGETIKIVAFAGTGKTTTLMRYAQLRPNLRFLFVVFNRSVKEYCSSRFPPNVECLTLHSLAKRSSIGVRFSDDKICGNFIVKEIREQTRLRKYENHFEQAKLIRETLQSFMCSADREINHRHVPFFIRKARKQKEFVGNDRRDRVVEDARKIWRLASDPGQRVISLPHDGYLKLYQLSQPDIHDFDVLLIDEAQDLTPAIIDILKNQRQAKILVGDPNQQIYSFRGAVNAMELVPATTTYYLTQSFRFGYNIAHVANTCLELLKNEKTKILVGNSSGGCVNGEASGQIAILARCNFTVFKEAVQQCRTTNKGTKIAFPGGSKAFGFSTIMDIYWLYKGEKHNIQSDFIRRFQNLDKLQHYADTNDEPDMDGKIKIVRQYGDRVVQLVQDILNKCTDDVENADIVLSTAHKSKGLEFTTVRVADDFADGLLPGDPDTERIPLGKDEYNLLYVAVTRAKTCLQLTPTLMRLMQYAGEKYRVPVYSSVLQQRGHPFQCVVSSRAFSPHAVTLTRKAMTLGDGKKVIRGVYCPQFVTQFIPALAGLYGTLTPQEHIPLCQEHPSWDPPVRVLQYFMPNFMGVVGLF